MEEIGKARLPFVNGGIFAMYLQPELKRILNMSPKEFKKLRKKLSKEELDKFRFRVFIDGNRIIICKGNIFEAMRPAGVDEDIWKAFVASIIQDYGIDGAKHGIIAYFNKMLRKRIYTVLDVFGLDVPIGKFDPRKLDPDIVARLPKDIRDYLFSDSFVEGAKKLVKNGASNNSSSRSSKKSGD